MDLRLGQRLASRDLDQPTPVVLDFGDDARETAVSPSVKRIGGVAPRAAQGTSGQSDKHTETTGVGVLPLNAEKDFSEAHGRLRLIPTQDGPAAFSGNAAHAANRVDDTRMADRFQHREIAGTVTVHVTHV